MIALNKRNKRHHFVCIDYTKSFREDKIVVPNRSQFCFSSTFRDPYEYYQLTTDQLTSGSWKFALKSYDDMNNESSLVQGSVTIGSYQLPPRFLTWEYVDTHHIKLSWVEPSSGNPDYYIIYSNNGSGSIITTQTFEVIAGTIKTRTYNIPTNGTWKFRIEARTGTIESTCKFDVAITIPRTSQVPPKAFNTDRDYDIALTAENANGGKMKIVFVWLYGSKASKFRIYHDSGTGTIDYGSYIEFDRVDGYIQTYTTAQLWTGTDNRTFKFVIRAVTTYGVEDANVVEHEVVLDGKAPDAADSLTIGSTF